MRATSLGEWGESVAAKHLEGRGWKTLHRNFRSGRREIDLVVRRGTVVAFVEVKTRSDGIWGHPFEAITPRKVARLTAVAEGWVKRFGEGNLSYRFDAVSVIRDRRGHPAIEHLEDAWQA
jgi:putative endonuclease